MELNKIYNESNQVILKTLSDNSIDMFLEDMPFNSTNCDFEYEVDLQEYWDLRLTKIKKNGIFVLCGQESFSSYLRLSNIKMYKYDYVWIKERPTNVYQIKKRPGKNIENIMVFYTDKCTYNVQKSNYTGPKRTNKVKNGKLGKIIDGSTKKVIEYNDDGTRYPLQSLFFKRDCLVSNLHPTQKPIDLFKFLIETYTNENDIIFDGYSGSGTTAQACLETKRNYICCENNKKYYDISIERIRKFKELNDTIQNKENSSDINITINSLF